MENNNNNENKNPNHPAAPAVLGISPSAISSATSPSVLPIPSTLLSPDDPDYTPFQYDPKECFWIECSKVILNERTRKDIDAEKLQSLATSLKIRGQLQPIVLDDDNNLKAGGRRFLATKDILKNEKILAIRRSSLGELDDLLVELEENTEREPFTWIEEVGLTRRIHLLVAKEAGRKPNIRQTVARTGLSIGKVHGNLTLANEVIRGNDAITKIGSKEGALRALKTQKEREVVSELGARVLKRNAESKEISHYKVIHGDCRVILPTLPSETYDLILTDPIWGIDVGNAFRAQDLRNDSHFDDTPETLRGMIPNLADEFYRVTKKDAFVIVFLAQTFFPVWEEYLLHAGFSVRPQGLVWFKESGAITDMSIHPMPAYEMMIMASKGSKLLTHPTMDVFQYPRPPVDERLVITQKPIPLLISLVNIFSSPGDRILDPMCGSGGVLAAGTICGRFSDGIELDEQVANLAGYNIQRGIDNVMGRVEKEVGKIARESTMVASVSGIPITGEDGGK